MSFAIRRAEIADAETIAELWIEMMREHRDFERRVRLSTQAAESYVRYAKYHIVNTDSVVLVADAPVKEGPGATGPRVVGYCLAYRVANLPMFTPAHYGFVSDITVANDSRGQGLGERLMALVEKALRRMGVKHIQLQVYRANVDGERFWRNRGFEPYILGMWKDV